MSDTIIARDTDPEVDRRELQGKWWRDPKTVVTLAVSAVGVFVLATVGTGQVRFRVDVTPDGTSVWDWEFFWALVPQMLKGLLVTARATILGFLLAASLGLFLALGRRSSARVISWPTAGFIEFVRSTPLLVQLYVLFFAFPDIGIRLSPLQALIIGLGVHYGTYCSEAYRAGMDSVPKGQWEASIAMNLGPWTKWTRVILPQAIPNVLPALGNFLVAAFKDAPLGFAVTVTGVLFFATTISNRMFRPQEPFILIGIGFLLVSLPAAWLVRRLEERLAYERI